MRTKEEILAKRIVKFPEEDFYEQGYGTMTDESIKRNVYAAMDEYARQQAIAFQDWTAYNPPKYQKGQWACAGKIYEGPPTPEEIYDQFIEHQQSTDNKKQ